MKVLINEIPPNGGKTTLFNVEREDGKLLIDNTGSLSMVYYGHSEDEAKAFYEEQQTNNNVIWY